MQRALSMGLSILRTRAGLIPLVTSGLAAALLSVCLYAQEDAYVDARLGSQPEQKVYGGIGYGGGMGCGTGCAAKDPVKVELLKMIALDIAPAQNIEWTARIVNKSPEDLANDAALPRHSIRTLDWTIQITNTTQSTLYFPTSLSWSGNTRQVENKNKVLRLNLDLFAKCKGGEHGVEQELQSDVSLYGAVDHSSDTVAVEPGHWIIVVGRGAACPLPTNTNDEYQLMIGLDKVSWYKENDQDWEDALPILGFQQSPGVYWNGEATWLSKDAK